MSSNGESGLNIGGNKCEWPEVAIVILNWNNYEDTARCLESLSDIEYPSYQIYVVDNGSTDGSDQRLANEFTSCEFIFNNENLGFAAGCNQGIKRALNNNSEYILLLNNDTIAYQNDFLKHGINVSKSKENCGIVGGKIYYWPKTDKIWSTGGYIKFWSGEYHIGHNELDVGQYDEISQRNFISGALMLIDTDVIEDIGLLPEAYFFGKEEWEYSRRAIEAGYQLFYSPNFSIYHDESDSHDHSDPAYVYNSVLSKILFKRRNYPPSKYLIWIAFYWIYSHFVLPPRYMMDNSNFNNNLHFWSIYHATRHAVYASRNTEKITEKMLSDYRQLIEE